MREVAVMSLSADSGPSTGNASHMDCGRVAVKRTRTRRVAKLCLRPTPPIKIERTCVLNRTVQQAEWWVESLSTRRRRPLKPVTIYGWQHCLDRWILRNLGNKLVSEVGNGALRQFVEILTAARLAPKTFVNVVTVVEAL